MSIICPRVVRGNRGDIASRYGILQTLVDSGAAVSAVFACRDIHLPEPLRPAILPYGPVYNLWPRLGGLSALMQSRVVVWTGGLDLQDDSSLVKLLHTWLVFLSYRVLGLKLLLAMQGAGPLTTGLGRFMARRILAQVSLVLARDRGSHWLLAALMPPNRLRLAADGIFLEGFPTRDAPGPPVSAVSALSGAEGFPIVGLNVRLWFHFASSWVPYQFARERYRERAQAPMTELLGALADVVRHLRRRHRARVVLVSMYEPEVEPWEDDAPLLESLKEHFADDDQVILCRDNLSILDLCRLFTRFDLMIGMRLHSALIALRTGVPAIHLAYTLKGRDIYDDLGLADWAFDVDEVRASPARLIRLADDILGDVQRFAKVAAIVEPLVSVNSEALVDALRTVEQG